VDATASVLVKIIYGPEKGRFLSWILFLFTVPSRIKKNIQHANCMEIDWNLVLLITANSQVVFLRVGAPRILERDATDILL